MMSESLLDRIRRGPIAFDGGMGTELYRRGHFINTPFEGVNLSDPHLVEQIHREYVDVGAQVIETNTFASNRWKLRRVGLEEQHARLNQEAVAIARRAGGERAWVVGAIGPSGARWHQLSPAQRDEARLVFADQAAALLAGGVDGLVLETFSRVEELLAALERVRALTSLPLIAQVAFVAGGASEDGLLPAEIVKRLAAAGADVVGANCAEGPLELFAVAEQMVGRGVPISILPNAGYPKNVDGRMIYMATPEYFGVFSQRFLKLGVQAVGGCCGTTPEHIRPVANAVRMVSAGIETVEPPVRSRDGSGLHVVPREEVPVRERSPLARKLMDRSGFVVSVEVNPTGWLDPSKSIEAARMLQAAGVDVINIADGPRASVRMANWSLALCVQREVGMDSIVHVCTRDRNLLGLQSDLLGYHVMGLRNLVIITGDPPKMGDYPNATAVFDLDSIGAIRMTTQFNRGINPAGRDIGDQTAFLVACGVEPASPDYDRELRRLEAKLEAGAHFIMTQPVYDPTVLDRFLADIRRFDVPVLVGLCPLASHRNAEFLHNEVPGMQIPAPIRERMRKADKGPTARAEGVRIAQEALLAVRDRVAGCYIMPPLGRHEAAVEVLTSVGYQIPEAYRESWKP